MKRFLICLILVCCTVAAFAQYMYSIDLSKFPAASEDKSTTFDKTTNTFTVNKAESKGIYLGLGSRDISEYNIARIKYKISGDYGFHFCLDYDDNSIEYDDKTTYCPTYLSEMVIPLLKNQKRLRGIYIQGKYEIPFEKFTIESITFEKIANPQKTDVFANNEPPVIDTASKGTIDEKLSAWDFLERLGVGLQYPVFFNFDFSQDYGNDIYGAYQRPSKKEIRFIKEKGFKTLRLQTNCCWHMMDKDYKIDPRFIKEIKRVVDFAIEEDMYVIICGPFNEIMNNPAYMKKMAESVHYSGYLVSEKDKKESEKFIQAIWKQYAEAFNNSYDEHLIFETLNEPVDRFHEHNFHEKTDCTVCKKDFAILNEYNQIIVDTIRATGGNNTNRFIMIEGLAGGWRQVSNNLFKIPKDNAKNKLIPTVHMYPMHYPGERTLYSEKTKLEIKECFDLLDKYYFSKKMPVYISETGNSRWTPIMDRIDCMKDFMAEVKKDGRSCAVTMQDNQDITGWIDLYGYYDKWNLKWFDTEYIDTIIYAAEGKEFPLGAEFFKKNETKIESIVGKNLLTEDFDPKSWDAIYKINPDTFVRSVPESYKLEFVIKKIGSSPTIQLTWQDDDYHDYQWHKIPTNSKKLKGGSLSDGNIRPSKTTFTVEIDAQTAKTIENSSGLFLMGQDVIIQSMKVVE